MAPEGRRDAGSKRRPRNEAEESPAARPSGSAFGRRGGASAGSSRDVAAPQPALRQPPASRRQPAPTESPSGPAETRRAGASASARASAAASAWEPASASRTRRAGVSAPAPARRARPRGTQRRGREIPSPVDCRRPRRRAPPGGDRWLRSGRPRSGQETPRGPPLSSWCLASRKTPTPPLRSSGAASFGACAPWRRGCPPPRGRVRPGGSAISPRRSFASIRPWTTRRARAEAKAPRKSWRAAGRRGAARRSRPDLPSAARPGRRRTSPHARRRRGSRSRARRSARSTGRTPSGSSPRRRSPGSWRP